MAVKGKWQKVINSWDKWIQSQKKAKAQMHKSYPNKLPLLKYAKVIIEDTTDKKQNFKLFINEYQWLKWDTPESRHGNPCISHSLCYSLCQFWIWLSQDTGSSTYRSGGRPRSVGIAELQQ